MKKVVGFSITVFGFLLIVSLSYTQQKTDAYKELVAQKLNSSEKIIINSELIDPRDGQRYKTIKVGNKIWMAENLNYDAGDGSYCYDDNYNNCDRYGKLYTWYTATEVAPPGWHLPSKSEFEELLDYYGGSGSNTFRKLIEGGSAGFDAKFSGYRGAEGNYFNSGSSNNPSGHFWTSTSSNSNNAWLMSVGKVGSKAEISTNVKSAGFSIRCVKDVSQGNILIDPRDEQRYKTIKVGNKIWMAENLNYDAGDGSYCYDDNYNNCDRYGKLYTWYTATEVAPPGWHLPSKSEFEELLDYYGGSGSNTFRKLIEGGSAGFDAKFSGYRGAEGNYFNSGSSNNPSGHFWTSTSSNSNNAWLMSVGKVGSKAEISTNVKSAGFSIRCVKD